MLKLMEFFLNEFHWIQWIMTKSKNGMVTKGITSLATATLPMAVKESVFPLLPVGRYPLWLITVNRHHPRDSNGNIFFTATSRNVSVVNYGVSLVTRLLLDFVLIQWIRWIQWKSFRKNSNIQLFIFCRWKVCESTPVVVEIKFVAVSERNQESEIPSEQRK